MTVSVATVAERRTVVWPRLASRDRRCGSKAGKEQQGIVPGNFRSRLPVQPLIALKPQEHEGGEGLAHPRIITAKEQLRRLNQGQQRAAQKRGRRGTARRNWTGG